MNGLLSLSAACLIVFHVIAYAHYGSKPFKALGITTVLACAAQYGGGDEWLVIMFKGIYAGLLLSTLMAIGWIHHKHLVSKGSS